VPSIPLKSRGFADENRKFFDGMEMIRKCSLTRTIRVVVATSSGKVKLIFYN
jgi:hypothetical protein